MRRGVRDSRWRGGRRRRDGVIAFIGRGSAARHTRAPECISSHRACAGTDLATATTPPPRSPTQLYQTLSQRRYIQPSRASSSRRGRHALRQRVRPQAHSCADAFLYTARRRATVQAFSASQAQGMLGPRQNLSMPAFAGWQYVRRLIAAVSAHQPARMIRLGLRRAPGRGGTGSQIEQPACGLGPWRAWSSCWPRTIVHEPCKCREPSPGVLVPQPKATASVLGPPQEAHPARTRNKTQYRG